MKEKPIIFRTHMIKAILDGKKSMTRRVIKPRYRKGEAGFEIATDVKTGAKGIIILTEEGGHARDGYYDPPYEPGDILWVRETHAVDRQGNYIYKADPIFDDCCPGDIAWKWKSPIFLPHEAARLFLEVKSVRIERLQKITPEDCVNEGSVKKPHYMTYGGDKCLALHGRYKTEFAKLWDSINAKCGYSWESNPWVWVYEFIRIEKGGGE